MSKNEDRPKIGAGHAQAMLRQGLAELRSAVYPGSNVAQPPQYGLYGTKTPGEVMQEKQLDSRDPDEQPRSILDEHLRRAESGRLDRDERHRDITKE